MIPYSIKGMAKAGSVKFYLILKERAMGMVAMPTEMHKNCDDDDDDNDEGKAQLCNHYLMVLTQGRNIPWGKTAMPLTVWNGNGLVLRESVSKQPARIEYQENSYVFLYLKNEISSKG